METLLQKAKNVKVQRYEKGYISDKQTVELALAWARDEVSTQQVATALGYKTGGYVYSILAKALRSALYKPDSI